MRYNYLRNILRLSTASWLVYIIGYILLKGKYPIMTVFASVPSILYALFPLLLVVLHLITDRVRGLVVASTLGLALGLTQLYPNIFYSKLEYDDQPESVAIKIMNWNTEMWDMGKDTDEFYDFVVRQDADIYILQERLYNADYKPVIDEPERFTHPYPITTAVSGFSYDYVSPQDYSRLTEHFPGYYIAAHQQFLVLSRYPIVESRLDPSDQYQVVDIDIDGSPFRVFNVHILLHLEFDHQIGFINPLNQEFYKKLQTRFDARKIGFDNLNNDVSLTRTEYIIAGDFNTTRHMGLMDSLFSTQKDLFSYSREILPSTIKVLGTRLWQIDYVFMNKDSKSLVTSFYNEPVDHLSDHNMQLLELQLSQSTVNESVAITSSEVSH